MNHKTAFPIQSYTCAEKGMTMRDYFAAQAMQGFCSTLGDVLPNSPPYWSVLAGDAYVMADAMMKARES
jgi:hypothetical protein